MQDIKLKAPNTKKVKTIDRIADLSERIKKAASRTTNRVQNLADDGKETPSEYAGDQLQHGMEDIATEAGHIVVDTGKQVYRKGKSAVQDYIDHKYRREPEPKGFEQADIPKPVEPRWSPSNDAVSSSPQRSRAPAPELKGRTEQITEEAKLSARKMVRQKPQQTIKTVQKTSDSVKQTAKAAERTAKNAERSIKATQNAIKTAEQTSKAAIKTAQESAKAAQKTAEVTAKATEKAAKAAQAAAKAAAEAAKLAAEAAAKAIQAIVAGIKSLVSAIAAGGWVSVVIIVVIMLIAIIVGSCYGIFFSSEDTGSPTTMQALVQDINKTYEERLDTLRTMTVYDNLEMSGSRAVWPEVLAIYAVRINLDPDNPQEVATIDDNKIAMLNEIFWEMNRITSHIETKEQIVIVEVIGPNGEIIEAEKVETITTLYIKVAHKDVSSMAILYGFTQDQKDMLQELLREENASLWAAVLYGIHDPNEQIVAVAKSQVGNVGGQPYWSWYGYGGRVEWCACFVSWCANECGYLEDGIIPKFAGCGTGTRWFKERGQWADNSITPVAGMIIFFDWDSEENPQDGRVNHVGIVEKVENGRVYTIEGNSGDRVREKSYPIGWYEIYGYGIPAY